MSDFRIPPSESLSIESVSAGPAQSALSGLAQATREQQQERTDALANLSKAAAGLQKIGLDAADVSSNVDVLHAINDLNDTAVQIGSTGNMKPIYSSGGEDGTESSIAGYDLGPEWQQKQDNYLKTLTDKYAAFPAVQAKVSQQLMSASIEANKVAVDAAFKKNLDDGKQAVLNAFDAATQESIKTGKTDLIDAVAANPANQKFIGPATIEQLRVANVKKAQDGILQKNLDKIAVTQGKDAAILAIPEGLDRATYDDLASRIDTMGNAASGASTMTAVQNYDKARKNGATDTDAQQTALAGVPDAYADTAQKAVQAHATRMITEADASATKTLEDASLNNGYAAALTALHDPKNNMAANLKQGSYRTWDTFLNKMANADKNEPINLNDPKFLPYMLDAFDKTKGEQQKLQEWRDAVNSGAINGKQFDWLNQHQKYNSDALYNVVTMIHDKTVTNPKTGMVDLDPILGMHVINSVEEFVVNRARDGKYPDPAEIQTYADKLVSDEMNKSFQKYFEDSFSSSGWAQFWGSGPIDAGKLNDVQTRIEAGDFKDYGKTTEGAQKLAQVRTAQQTEFASLYPKIKIGAAPQGHPAMDDMGQQFFYSGANMFARVVQNGKGIWATKKVTDPDTAWAPLEK